IKSKGEEGTISVDGNLCFCETCHKIRVDESFHTNGNPPKQYAQPVGWYRFSLVTVVGENNEFWHMAYHGIKGGAIRRMLDKGELLFAGELGVNTRLANRKSREDASDGSVLIFSPSVVYASLDELAPPIS
ncbi:Neuralized-like protein 4, partial [Armadillidium vulgare]